MTIEKQATFDFVVGKIREQGCASVKPDSNSCLYRGPNGTKCAAGHVIPDEKYDPCFEGCTVPVSLADWDSGNTKKLYEVLKETGHDLNLLRSLQRAHDSISMEYNFLAGFEKNVQHVAEFHELVYTPPKE